MNYTVYYLKCQYSRDAIFTTAKSVNPSHYDKVATVSAENLEDLFRRMNCVDGSKIEYVGRGLGQLPIRSLSVGDVVVQEGSGAFLCAVVGWEPVMEWRGEHEPQGC